MPDVVIFLIAGAFGSLAKDIFQDGRILLPYRDNGFLVLGFIGGMVIGAFVGWVIDGNFITAALAGYVGTSAISHLLPSSNDK